MRGIFFDVLEVNIVVSVFILLLGIGAKKLRNRYGAGWMRLVWLLLAVRLMIPYNVTLPSLEINLLRIPMAEQGEQRSEDYVQKHLGWFESEWGTAEEGLENSVYDTGIHQENASQTDAGQQGSVDEEAQTENMQSGIVQSGIAQSGVEQMKIGQAQDPGEYSDMPEDSESEIGIRELEVLFADLPYTEIFAGIWMIGSIMYLLQLASCGIRFGLVMKKGRTPVVDKDFIRQVEDLQEKYIGKKSLPVYQSRQISSPMLMGYVKPTLIFPDTWMEWDVVTLEYVTAHELCHHRRKDLWLKLLMNLACCVNWFNPLVYYMKKQFFYDIELSCDSSVLAGKDGKEREAYARLILMFAGDKRNEAAFSTDFGIGKEKMKQRIDYMLDGKAKKKGYFSMAAAMLCVLAIGLFVSCGSEEVVEPDAEDEQKMESYSPNHAYNSMICFYEEDIYIDRADGIYQIKAGQTEETLIYSNEYSGVRGLEIYQEWLYFCGSVVKDGESVSTIYRLDPKTNQVEDLLADLNLASKRLSEVQIYEDNLYVKLEWFGLVGGFALDKEGKIDKVLDDQAEDFIYKEQNEYSALSQEAHFSSGSYDYWNKVEELKDQYTPLMDVAACKELLDGAVLVSIGKNENLRSICLLAEDGTYEYLLDAGYDKSVLITEGGFYYFPELSQEFWFMDFETRETKHIFTGGMDVLEEIRLLTYDEEYVYFAGKKESKKNDDGTWQYEGQVLRIPRDGGTAELVCVIDDVTKIMDLSGNCAVVGDYMYFRDFDTVQLPGSSVGGMNFEVVEQFEIADGTPCVVKNGVLYRYTGANSWQQVPEAGELTQIVSDSEYFCGISTEGKIIHNMEPATEDLPLTGAYYDHMTGQLLEINEENAFLSINGAMHWDCMALLEDGRIAYPSSDEYHYYQMEETPIAVSGEYILTEAGNVYYMRLDPSYAEGPTPECIYDGGDIRAIEADNSTGELLGLTAEGKVISWRIQDYGEYMLVADWENVVAVKQGFHFAVGLREDGKVLYADYSEENSRHMTEALSTWKDIIAITEWGTNIYGLKSDGSLYSMEVTFDDVATVKRDFEPPLPNIKWGMMPQEVLEIMPTPSETYEHEDKVVTLVYEDKNVFGYAADVEMVFSVEPAVGLYEIAVYFEEDSSREALVDKLNEKYGDYTRVNSEGKPSQWDSETIGDLSEEIQERFRVAQVEYPALKANLENDFSQETLWNNLKKSALVSVRLGSTMLNYNASGMAGYRMYQDDVKYQEYLDYFKLDEGQE